MSNTTTLQPHHFSSGTFYPDVRLAESKDVVLQPLSILVWFSGAVPHHLAHSNIPIEITVSLKDEYKSFTVPVIEIASQQHHHSNNSMAFSQSCSATDSDLAFSFLPLLPAFDHTDSDHWAELLDNIQSWLVKSVDPITPEWTWGREVFWYAFIATHPDFPSGKWSFWDPSIPLEGQFIEEWVGSGGVIRMAIDDDDDDDDDGKLTTVSTHGDTLDYIWSEFSRHIVLFYPYPLVSTS
ncbi:hypothetical protein DEU56DRAFT_917615 [Suillus clintonianus]|uniref:uncharacterized protein n=1 Tax=Suillus clintonianus TaxID=1904413 RepID=UPI001B8855E0|nr:uncharacterized protein DEU56DRAFT_917615 [Suillus clintonianus]KAG2122909.1 hypothetical protein DEU56DRAFT_917615 [Suillus clintonianus]